MLVNNLVLNNSPPANAAVAFDMVLQAVCTACQSTACTCGNKKRNLCYGQERGKVCLLPSPLTCHALRYSGPTLTDTQSLELRSGAGMVLRVTLCFQGALRRGAEILLSSPRDGERKHPCSCALHFVDILLHAAA